MGVLPPASLAWAPGVDTVDVDTVDVDTVDVDTVEVYTVGVDTVDVYTVDVDTVDVYTVDVDCYITLHYIDKSCLPAKNPRLGTSLASRPNPNPNARAPYLHPTTRLASDY